LALLGKNKDFVNRNLSVTRREPIMETEPTTAQAVEPEVMEMFNDLVQRGWLFYLLPSQSFIMREDSTPVAVIECAMDTFGRGHIIMLYVREQWRRRGFATRMMKAAENQYVGELIIWCSDENKPMKSLLNKLGYQRLGKIHDFYPNGDTGLMWRKECQK